MPCERFAHPLTRAFTVHRIQANMNGQLNEQPLAELVREISQERLAGTLRLQHEAMKTALYFEAGQITYAASNLRELRLGEYLRKQNLVSEEQLTALGNSLSDLSLATALSANGIMDQESVSSWVAKQVTDLLLVVLLQTKGAWEFDERTHLGDSVPIKLDTGGLLLQAARKMPLKFVTSRLSDPDELLSPVAAMPDFGSVLPEEGFVLSRVDSPIKLSDLISFSGLPEEEAIRTIYGLALGRFIGRERWPAALRPSKVTAKTVVAPIKEEPVAPSIDDSEQAVARDLDNLFRRLDVAGTHYEVLNIDVGAEATEIKQNYYALARRYHPDRFHLQAGTAQHMRIEAAFAKIAQAYFTLSDSALRSSYDSKLRAREKTRQIAQNAPKASAPETVRAAVRQDKRTETSVQEDLDRAESSFQEGYAALQQGQIQSAITNLAAAARIFPKEARFRAYYGRALASQEETRRLAEAEIQAAIKLDQANPAYRVMLAELYCDLGFFRRAEGELKRVMATESNNPTVQKLMKRLVAARTTS